MLAQKFQALTDAAKKAGKGPKPAAPAPAAAAPAPAAAAGSGPAGFKSTAVFEKIAANLKSDATLTKKVKGSFLFNVTGGPRGASATWFVDAKGTEGVKAAVPPATKADCTITISDDNMVAMATGKLTGMQAFMSGKMKIKGNMGLAQKFGAIVDGAKSKM